MNREELAAFLKIRRGRIQPGNVGLPDGTRRRTPGLRRQEVAQLAGMSVDYYIRLEQARGPRPSRQVLNALARALMLNLDERAHLFHLVGETPEPSAAPSRDVPDGITHLLAAMTEVPAYIVDAGYTVLAANALARAFMANLPREKCTRGNIVRVIFAQESAAQLSDPDHLRFARSCVADLRAAAARYPDDVALRTLIDDLLRTSPEFGEIWAEHEVEVRRNMSKRIDHPLVGPIDVECQVLLVPERDQRLILYVAEPGSPSQHAIQELARLHISLSDDQPRYGCSPAQGIHRGEGDAGGLPELPAGSGGRQAFRAQRRTGQRPRRPVRHQPDGTGQTPDLGGAQLVRVGLHRRGRGTVGTLAAARRARLRRQCHRRVPRRQRTLRRDHRGVHRSGRARQADRLGG
nr:helix-turn-helix transcriptional regulator [Stackebrandtia nassauensis]